MMTRIATVISRRVFVAGLMLAGLLSPQAASANLRYSSCLALGPFPVRQSTSGRTWWSDPKIVRKGLIQNPIGMCKVESDFSQKTV